MSLTSVGEDFYDLVGQGSVQQSEYNVSDWRERLRSHMADFVAESAIGWGQCRRV